MPTENTQAASSAQTENQNAENAQNAQSTQSTQQSEEKKYTDTEMNNISKKNSEKAVSKLLKELGITDKEKAKQILMQAAEQENAASGNNQADRETELETRLAAAEKQTQIAVLENIFLSRKVKAEKISRAVRLVDIESCLDDDGKFSREKAENAVTQLLTEWPELSPTDDGAQVGFKVGADGSAQQNSASTQKKTIQKSWNRFNT